MVKVTKRASLTPSRETAYVEKLPTLWMPSA